MPNLKAKIDGDNKVPQNTPPSQTESCNCLKKKNYPMKGAYLSENILYYAQISFEDAKYDPNLYKRILFIYLLTLF